MDPSSVGGSAVASYTSIVVPPATKSRVPSRVKATLEVEKPSVLAAPKFEVETLGGEVVMLIHISPPDVSTTARLPSHLMSTASGVPGVERTVVTLRALRDATVTPELVPVARIVSLSASDRLMPWWFLSVVMVATGAGVVPVTSRM